MKPVLLCCLIFAGVTTSVRWEGYGGGMRVGLNEKETLGERRQTAEKKLTPVGEDAHVGPAKALSLGADGWHAAKDYDHGKRSGDTGYIQLQAVLVAQAQKLGMLEADIQSIKNLGTLEAEIQSTKAELQSTKVELQSAKTEIQSAKAERRSTKMELQSVINGLQSTDARTSYGSSFVRWGRSTCPGNDTRLLYSGFAGGAHYTHAGSGANRLCLTKEPVFDDTPGISSSGYLYGMQYYFPGHLHTDALCAVCHSLMSVTFMVPGTNRCPPSTVQQYRGYLTSGNHKHAAPSEFLCMDEAPEERHGSKGDQSSGFFDQVKTACGALPCPPPTPRTSSSPASSALRDHHRTLENGKAQSTGPQVL